MAVTVARHYIGTEGRFEVNESEYTHVYSVQFDTKPTDASEAVVQAGVPRIGDEHPLDGSAFVVKLTPKATESPYVYFVEVVYSNAVSGTIGQDDDPLQDLPEIELFTSEELEYVTQDLDNVPLINSAGIPFDPLPIRRALFGVRVSRNLANVSVSTRAPYLYARNTMQFNGIAPLGCLCSGYSASKQSRNGTEYWRETFEFTVKLWGQGFKTQVLDHGHQYTKIGQGGKTELYEMKDANGDTLSRPQLLDGTGKVLPFGGTPVYIPFRTIPDADFNNITPKVVF